MKKITEAIDRLATAMTNSALARPKLLIGVGVVLLFISLVVLMAIYGAVAGLIFLLGMFGFTCAIGGIIALFNE